MCDEQKKMPVYTTTENFLDNYRGLNSWNRSYQLETFISFIIYNVKFKQVKHDLNNKNRTIKKYITIKYDVIISNKTSITQ